jgi:hypothetical protein
MSDWILAKDIETGDTFKYEIEDKAKVATVIKNIKSWDGPYKGGRETEFTILFDNNDKIVIEWDVKLLKI